jgi:hypothetical protein
MTSKKQQNVTRMNLNHHVIEKAPSLGIRGLALDIISSPGYRSKEPTHIIAWDNEKDIE